MNGETSTVDAVADLLEDHVGKHDAISSAEIRSRLGIDDAEARPVTRGLIRDVVKHRGIPVAASKRGYYVIANANELYEYVGTLTGRIRAIKERRELVIESFEQDERHGVIDDYL